MAKEIKSVDFESELGQEYTNYAMSVITERAIPDVRDGLKPVQRRVLYATSELVHSDKPHRKCARIVGDTMGKYHPHGDTSIYGALVNMAQPWKTQNCLIDGHGNFGGIDGSGAAAMRYTEARLSEYVEDACLKDLDFYKEDFVPNFEETENEPTYLPFLIPNILVNGSEGIAVGIATKIPTHNLGEVVDATIAYMKNPKITTRELLEIMPGPDFATGGIINASKETLLQAYETGSAKIKIRGKVEVRPLEKGRKAICATEIPITMFNGRISNYMQDAATLARNQELENVVDIADRGGKDGECIAIDLKKGTDDDVIANNINVLYKKTCLEDTYGINMVCIKDNEPKTMGLRDILESFYEFKKVLYNKKYNILLEKQRIILEEKQGLAEAIDIIDLIIEIIRGSKSQAIAKDCLMTGNTSKITFKHKESEKAAKELHFTERQAKVILDTRLSQLIAMEIEALLKQIEESQRKIKKYEALLGSEVKMRNVMIEDMLALKEKYAQPRKTAIEDLGTVTIKEVQQKVEEVTVLLDRFYYIKVIDRDLYEKNKEQVDKEYRFVVNCNNVDRIGLFASDNQMHMIKVMDIIKQQLKKQPIKKKKASVGAKLSDKGIQIFEFCKMVGNEEILYLGCIEQFDKLVFVTKTGKAKVVDGAEFDVTRKAIGTMKDPLLYIGDFDDQLVASSKEGFYIRINTDELPTQGKGSGGVRLINLSAGDELVNAVCGKTSDNIGKIPFTRIKLLKRGAKGTKIRV